MAGFTDEEISAAIDRYLLSTVSVPVLQTGARDIKSLRNQVYDLVTSTFLLRPDSFFYVVWLATNKLKLLIQQQQQALDLIDQYGPNLTRPSLGIGTTTDLTNAQAALLDVSSGLGARTVGVRGSIGPAVDRFQRSVTSFIQDELVKNVVVGGQVTETGDELRAKLTTLWAAAADRHNGIVDLAQSISGALTEFTATALPQTAIASIVTKIQDQLEQLQKTMEGSQAIQLSRESMLELLTMRTMLRLASTFTTPSLSVAPLTGDATTCVPVDSPGTEASITGTVSGPYNYPITTTVGLSVNTGAYTPSALLPGSSVPELRSVSLLGLFPTPNFTEAAVVVDLGATSVYSPPAYATGAAAAADLTANLTGVSVTWDAGNNQLVFRSLTYGDSAGLKILRDTGLRASFVDFFFTGAILEARCPVVQIDAVVASFAALSPLLRASASKTNYFSDNYGERSSVGGEEAWLWLRKDRGLDLVTDGTNVVTSPSKDFTALGVKPGMGLVITSPPGPAGTYVITAVDGPALTLATAPAASIGCSYYVGPDLSTVPVGARVQLVSTTISNNTGYYRVSSAGVAKLVLDRNIPSANAGLVVSVYTHYLTLAARGTTTLSGIGVTAGGAPLGFSVAPEVRAGLSEISVTGTVDLLARGARGGELVTLTDPGGTVYQRVLASATTSGFTLTQPVTYRSGAWSYLIQNNRVYQYDGLVGFTDDFLAQDIVTGFSELDSFIGRLIRGGAYSADIIASVGAYRLALQSLSTGLLGYSVPAETTIDNVIRTMREQGFDRATDLFLALQFATFFALDADGVSYSTWLTNRAAKSARLVAPVTKTAHSELGRQQWRPLSFQVSQLDPLRTDPHDRQ